MKVSTGIRYLDQIFGGTLNFGTVPFDRFATLAYASNAGAVAVAAAGTQVLTLGVSNVVVDQKILLVTQLGMTKGAVAGYMESMQRQSAGTSTGVFANNLTSTFTFISSYPANDFWQVITVGIWRVTGAGSLTFETVGYSGGSNANCAIDGCQMIAISFLEA